MRILNVVRYSDSRAGKSFDLCVLILILLSVVMVSVETLPSLPGRVIYAFGIAEVIITLLFTGEYILRITAAEKKWNYILSFYGIVDLAAILPFYISAGVDLRGLRIIRLLRIVRILKLARYSRTMELFGHALKRSKDQFVVFFFVTATILYIAALGIYHFEHNVQPETFGSVFHSLWWAVATLTTVGYGDVYPVSIGGRIFASIVMLCGLAVVAAPAGIIASALTEVSQKSRN